MRIAGGRAILYGMSKMKGRKGSEERRRAQFAALQERAASEPAPEPRREHIQPVDVTNQEEKYEPLLLAIESGFVEVYEERHHLPVDTDAEHAARLLIARFEGDSGKRSGSPDVDALADAANRHIELLFRRHPLLSRAEIIGCLRRIITSVRTWHEPGNPRAYLEFVREFVHERVREQQEDGPERNASGLWVPGQQRQDEEQQAPRRPGGLWLPGDS